MTIKEESNFQLKVLYCNNVNTKAHINIRLIVNVEIMTREELASSCKAIVTPAADGRYRSGDGRYTPGG